MRTTRRVLGAAAFALLGLRPGAGPAGHARRAVRLPGVRQVPRADRRRVHEAATEHQDPVPGAGRELRRRPPDDAAAGGHEPAAGPLLLRLPPPRRARADAGQAPAGPRSRPAARRRAGGVAQGQLLRCDHLARPRRRQALRDGVQRLLADDVFQQRPREEGGRRPGQDARHLGRRAGACDQDPGRWLGCRRRRLQRPRLAGRLALARHDPAGRRQNARRERVARSPSAARSGSRRSRPSARWSPTAACR